MGLFTRKQAAPQADLRWEALNAEYQNYRRRTAQELEAAGGKSARQTAAAFLPIYDDLQRALDRLFPLRYSKSIMAICTSRAFVCKTDG